MTSIPLERRGNMLLRIIFLLIGTVLLAGVYYLLSCKLDFLIAKWMGDVQAIEKTGWTSYGNVKWTFSSLLGPAWAVHISVALAVTILSGFFLSLLLTNAVFRITPFCGRYYWIAIAVVLTWILRIPVPIQYSLFYFTAVRY